MFVQVATETLSLQHSDEAASHTSKGVEIDPLLDLRRVLRARHYPGHGDIPAAEQARRMRVLYPEGSADPALVETLVNVIALAEEQG